MANVSIRFWWAVESNLYLGARKWAQENKVILDFPGHGKPTGNLFI